MDGWKDGLFGVRVRFKKTIGQTDGWMDGLFRVKVNEFIKKDG